MLEYFCFKIKNFEEYSKKNSVDKLNYEIHLKERLSEKFKLVIFPTCTVATVLVRIWPEKNFDQMLVPITYPFAHLVPVKLSAEELKSSEYVLTSEDLDLISHKSPYRNELNFLKSSAGITNATNHSGIFTAYGFQFQIETLILALKKLKPKSITSYFTDMFDSTSKNSYASALTSSKDQKKDVKDKRLSFYSNYISDQTASNNNGPRELAHNYKYKNVQLIVCTESIIDVKIEAITNSLDINLNFNGTGIANLIYKKFGNKIDERTVKNAKKLGDLSHGMCFEVETLKAIPKYVINVISPLYNPYTQNDFIRELKFTFINLFECANNHLKLSQLGLPLLCTGNYGAPKQLCANILANSLFDFLDSARNLYLKEIHFVNIDQATTDLLVEEIELLLVKNLSVSEDNFEEATSTAYEEMEHSGKMEHKENFEIIDSSPRKSHTKKILYNENKDFITCQLCRQRTRSWIEIVDCKLKICLLCDGETKDNQAECFIEGCTQSAEQEQNDEPTSRIENLKVCKICQEDTLTSDEFVKLKNCGHELCKTCFERMNKVQPKCPFCQKWFDKPIGEQPLDGSMNVKLINRSLSGFNGYETLEITYSFPDGIQQANHPNPGKPYAGINRIAYLPYTIKGKHVLKLLKIAFDCKLVFTIGDSISTSAKDVITWNDIHHKTSISGEFGYPDNEYLERVTAELKAKGIE